MLRFYLTTRICDGWNFRKRQVKMPEGTIKLIEKKHPFVGCIQGDSNRMVYVFCRAGVAQGYKPKLGDRVTFRVKASERSGHPEAIQFQLLDAA
jgi:hypothetical protein